MQEEKTEAQKVMEEAESHYESAKEVLAYKMIEVALEKANSDPFEALSKLKFMRVKREGFDAVDLAINLLNEILRECSVRGRSR